MLTQSRSELLGVLLDATINDFDIPEDLRRLADQRYREVGAYLSDYYDGNAADGLIYAQGSFQLGTVVQPVSGTSEYDIDLVCRRDLVKASTTQAELKTSVGDGLRAYVATTPAGRPQQIEGARVWTLNYSNEPFHMDVLPSIPNQEVIPNGILITDRELRNWRPSNPIDYAAWFHGLMTQEFAEAREVLAKRMEVDKVPDWSVKTTLQRTVQALKRHRDFHFSAQPELKPPSIIVTTLAGLAYQGGSELYEVLVDVAAKMPELLARSAGVWWLPNPVDREENLVARWGNAPEEAAAFFDWVANAHAAFSSIGSQLGTDHVIQEMAKSFGERSASHAGELYGVTVTNARGEGRLAITGAGTLAEAATRRHAVPDHTFHGDPET